MPSMSAVIVLLAIVSACVVAMTILLWTLTIDLRRTLSRMNAMLPHCDHAAREVQRTLGEVRQLLSRTRLVARHVETVVHKACDVTSDVLEQVTALKGRAKTFFTGHFGNGHGAGAEPRRHYRGSGRGTKGGERG